ncbi:hypothetical protein HaLaN_07738 [Haematococcus lacustris]|uniref:Uncharacterized protein n=1 Tax=Haematococcus lacustris TaxID=44745 RepID=A0A699YZQ5_HAELA|nr:hypothetical protein HaLaN_07738 [Haematococcus lacustris]
MMLVGEVMFHHLLDLEQAAKVMVYSWPVVPDTLALLHASAGSSRGLQAPCT